MLYSRSKNHLHLLGFNSTGVDTLTASLWLVVDLQEQPSAMPSVDN